LEVLHVSDLQKDKRFKEENFEFGRQSVILIIWSCCQKMLHSAEDAGDASADELRTGK